MTRTPNSNFEYHCIYCGEFFRTNYLYRYHKCEMKKLSTIKENDTTEINNIQENQKE